MSDQLAQQRALSPVLGLTVPRPGAVRIWLLAVAALVFAMVSLGGATRLTGSGLSITEWQPIMGAVPPLSEAAWLEVFERYKQIPQYELVNRGMSLGAFKLIYWWEWTHRFLGRLIGVAFLVPFLYFLAGGQLSRPYDGSSAESSRWAGCRASSAGTWSAPVWPSASASASIASRCI